MYKAYWYSPVFEVSRKRDARNVQSCFAHAVAILHDI